MKRYDVCPAGGGKSGRRRLVVVLQHEHTSDLATAIVAPLFAANDLPMLSHVRVSVDVDGKRYVAAIDRMAAIAKDQLKRPIANLDEHGFAFTEGLDVLFSGF